MIVTCIVRCTIWNRNICRSPVVVWPNNSNTVTNIAFKSLCYSDDFKENTNCVYTCTCMEQRYWPISIICTIYFVLNVHNITIQENNICTVASKCLCATQIIQYICYIWNWDIIICISNHTVSQINQISYKGSTFVIFGSKSFSSTVHC